MRTLPGARPFTRRPLRFATPAGAPGDWQQLHAQADKRQTALEAAILSALLSAVPEELRPALAAAAAAYDAAAAQTVVDHANLSSTLHDALQPLLQAITADAAASVTADLGLTFDRTNPFALQVAESQAATLVTQVTAETRAAIQTVIAEAFRLGFDVDAVTRTLQATVGLTTRQAAAVTRYEAQLSGQGRAAEQVQRMVERYAKRLLKQRARLIARTEIMTASNAGQQLAWQQARGSGLLPGTATRKWIITPDDRLCPLCAQMRGDRALASLDGMFDTPLGPKAHPPMHPGCRCAMGLVDTLQAAEPGPLRLFYDPRQPRNKRGEWVHTGGGVEAYLARQQAATQAPAKAKGTGTRAKAVKPASGPSSASYADLGHDPPKDFVQTSRDWQQSLTKEETSAVKGYAGADYRAINGGLRGKGPPPDHATVAALDSALAKGSLDRDVTLYRGMNAQALSGLTKGATFTDKGYGSTSISRTVSRQFAQKRAKRGGGALVEIRAKQGTHGAYLDKMGNFAEREFLLPRNTKFKVVDIVPPANKLDFPRLILEVQ